MARLKHLLRLLAVTAAGLLVIVIALLLLAPWFINTKAIEQKIRGAITERTGRNVTYESLKIVFLPRPHLTIKALRIHYPGILSADISTLDVSSAILPLFTGNIQLAAVTMERPEVAVNLPPPTRETRSGRKPKNDADEATALRAALDDLRTYAPDLLWKFHTGMLVLREHGGRSWKLRKAEGRFQMLPKGLDLAISGTLDQWGMLSAKGRIDVGSIDDIAFSDVDLASGRSSITGLSARFTRKKRWNAEVRLEQALLKFDEAYRQTAAIESLGKVLAPLKAPTGTITLAPSSYQGPLDAPARGTLDLRGDVKDLMVQVPAIPEQVRVASGRFTASLKRFSLTDVRVHSLDSTVSVTASGALALPAIRSATITLNGTVGPKTMTWLVSAASLPPAAAVRTPLAVTKMRILYERGGATVLDSDLAVQQGPSVSVKFRRTADELALERLAIHDDGSSAVMSFHHRKGLLDVRFDGTLGKTTLDRLFVQTGYDFGSIAGNIEVHLDLSRPQVSRAQGVLQVDHIVVPGLLPALLDIRHAALHAEQDRIIVDAAEAAVNGQVVSLAGTVAMASDGFRFDADLRSATLDIKKALDDIFPHQDRAAQEGTTAKNKRAAPRRFSGALRWDVGLASYGTFTVDPLSATIGFDHKDFNIQFTKAVYCGIGLTGSLASSDQGLALRIRSRIAGLDLDPTLACAVGKDLKLSGKVDLAADLAAQGPPRTVLQRLGGSITIQARDGQILKATLISRLLALLNVTDILSGEYEGRDRGGIRYRSLEIAAELKDQQFSIRELIMDSEVMDLTGQGYISLADGTLDLKMLVAPIKTGNWLVKKIPLVRDILDGTLITIPVKATGAINDPEIAVLSPSAVGEGLIGITKRTLQLPFKIIQPVIGGGKKKNE